MCFCMLWYWVSGEEMKCLCYYLQKSWSPGPLGTGGSALKACGMGAGWRGVPCIGLRGRCNALLLSDTAFLEHDTHLNTFFDILTNSSENNWPLCNSGRVFAHPQTAAHSCKRPPWSSLWRLDHEDTTPAQCHRRCHCTQAGRSGKPQERIHMHTHVQTNITES